MCVNRKQTAKRNKLNKGKQMTTVNQQKSMFYNAGLMANITMLAEKTKRILDFKYLMTCDETELRQLQENLIEDYNLRLKRKG